MATTSFRPVAVLIAVVASALHRAAAENPQNAVHLVTFWSDVNFGGDEFQQRMEPSICYNLADANNDRISSLNTHGNCVDLYTREDCSGGMFRMESNGTTRCQRDLLNCDMNNRVSSVRLCPRCRNSCYYDDDGRQIGGSGRSGREADDFGAEEVCQCNCNCAPVGACNGGNGDVYK